MGYSTLGYPHSWNIVEGGTSSYIYTIMVIHTRGTLWKVVPPVACALCSALRVVDQLDNNINKNEIFE